MNISLFLRGEVMLLLQSYGQLYICDGEIVDQNITWGKCDPERHKNQTRKLDIVKNKKLEAKNSFMMLVMLESALLIQGFFMKRHFSSNIYPSESNPIIHCKKKSYYIIYFSNDIICYFNTFFPTISFISACFFLLSILFSLSILFYSILCWINE